MAVNESSSPTPLLHARTGQQKEVHIRVEHLRVLARHSIFLFLGNLAGCMTLGFGLWPIADKAVLITWMSIMILFNAGRWIVGMRFPKGFINEEETYHWERKLVVFVAISGFLWGIAGILFYVPDQPEYILFLALIIVGMCAATTATLSFHRFAFPVFLLPAISPITLNLMSDNNLVANAVGFIIPFYFALLYQLSREIYRTANESIISRIDSQHQAMFDHLTGVANRRAFEEAMDREWYRALRDKSALSLVIGDIDDFKSCNDTYGHAVGDLVLEAVAELLERRIRRGTDLVARIGGEEFAIILPDTDLEGALTLVNSIRVGVRHLAEAYDKEIPQVTMSFGVSSLPPDKSCDTEILFRCADAALYQAKKKGKDRVESIDNTPSLSSVEQSFI
ncbi:MAG: GGDEF domain-containing protein [Gammaproteobacteria bacterium]|nr:GGDEF domain-containing protein [Gammaproteobacteria bacterium]